MSKGGMKKKDQIVTVFSFSVAIWRGEDAPCLSGSPVSGHVHATRRDEWLRCMVSVPDVRRAVLHLRKS